MRRMGRRRAWVLAFLVGGAALGCASTAQDGSLKVKVIASASETPSNVALHLSVDDKSGEPIEGLTPANFRIFEDGKLVSEDKAKRALLDPSMAEMHFLVLLVDLSGPIVESADFPELVRNIGQFVGRLKHTHQIIVSLFDGRDDLRTVLEPDETDVEPALARIRRYRPEDRKGNLNGAILKGLAALDRQMAASVGASKAGTLVIFTDRGDLAEKVPAEELEVALDKTPSDVYVIAAGEGIKRPELGKIARTDAFYTTNPKELGTGFTELGRHLEVAAAGHYLLSYCSPKRKGQHEVEVEVSTEKEHGKLTTRFNADGFKKGCSPKQRPAFPQAKNEPAPEAAPAVPARETAQETAQKPAQDPQQDATPSRRENAQDVGSQDPPATKPGPAAKPAKQARSASAEGKQGRKPERKPEDTQEGSADGTEKPE
jgi:hypothetical protein